MPNYVPIQDLTTKNLADTDYIPVSDGVSAYGVQATQFKTYTTAQAQEAAAAAAEYMAAAQSAATAAEQAVSELAQPANLFDASTIITGSYYDSNGNVQSESGNSARSEQYIPVSQDLYYYIGSGAGTLLVSLYNSSKVHQRRDNYGVSASGRITIPSGIAYIRVSVYGSTTKLAALTVSDEPVDETISHDVYKLKADTVGEKSIKDGVVTSEKLADNVMATSQVFYSFDLFNDDVTKINGYCSDSGTIVENASYRTFIFRVETDCECYFEQKYSYCSLCRYNGLPASSSTFISPRYRYNGSEDTIPKENSKLALYAGQYVALSFSANVGISYFFINDPYYRRELSANVYLGNTQLQQVLGNYALWYGSGHGEGVQLYFRSGNGNIGYYFQHALRQDINVDTWRIDRLAVADNEFVSKYVPTAEGEWECAVRLANRSDFSGGLMHGDEITTTLVFLFDGVPYSASEIKTKGQLYFKDLQIIEVSNLYDPADNETIIAEHGKIYDFKSDGLHLSQYVDWKINDTLAACYLAMLPPSKEYTDMCFLDTTYAPEMSESCYGDHHGVKKATQYSNDKGFLCSLEIKEYPTGYPGSDIFNLRDNDSDDYNKMYFNVCTGGTITSGTRWDSKSVYRFSIGEPMESEP